ncbi:coatomer subunit alpha-2 [Helianthus annuus]|uniref:Putative coatomer alpha subunit n=1 Tax=Helianthus annuus TaxID=4232 RepID=A0A251U0A2_HELAN|nr:coatomer subunit alpha-2 [Helianthus annuus]
MVFVMSQFHNALYLGDVQEQIKILENADHLPLAYVTAKTHGLNDIAERLVAELKDNVPALTSETPKDIMARSSVFVAPTPGMPVSQIWVQKSSVGAEHAAAVNFDTAVRLLKRQLGLKNFTQLKPLSIDLHRGSHSYLRVFSSSLVI